MGKQQVVVTLKAARVTGIACPRCGGKTATRSTVSRDGVVVRYRQCKVCGYHFSTTER